MQGTWFNYWISLKKSFLSSSMNSTIIPLCSVPRWLVAILCRPSYVLSYGDMFILHVICLLGLKMIFKPPGSQFCVQTLGQYLALGGAWALNMKLQGYFDYLLGIFKALEEGLPNFTSVTHGSIDCCESHEMTSCGQPGYFVRTSTHFNPIACQSYCQRLLRR
ncbi:hypothetical protein DFS33DRAFT_722228 [Desarmillaria ectypa]|nr:hypothetical protein DFS33DRAFT_722228 [Desarmillaria ectypa]